MKMESSFDLRLIKEFGLSLDTRKRYFVLWAPDVWWITYITDSLEDVIVNGDHSTMEEYYEYRKKYKEDFKGLFTNLTVWELLDHLHYAITDDTLHGTREDRKDMILLAMSDSMISSCLIPNP